MSGPEQQSQVLYVADLMAELKCGQHSARRIARKIGRRLVARRLVVTRRALEEYLKGGAGVSSSEEGRP